MVFVYIYLIAASPVHRPQRNASANPASIVSSDPRTPRTSRKTGTTTPMTERYHNYAGKLLKLGCTDERFSTGYNP